MAAANPDTTDETALQACITCHNEQPVMILSRLAM
jgi:hypothetical protein